MTATFHQIRREPPWAGWRSLVAFLTLSYGVAAVSGLVTADNIPTWYQGLHKPPFNPPNWLFGPVWTALYGMIAFAGWRLWRRRTRATAQAALIAWTAQLALNGAWSFLFFGAHLTGAALIDILLLVAAIVGAIVLSWRACRTSAALMAPYLAWVGFATVLNAAIWRLN